MILLHISETTSGEIQVSAVIPMSLNEVKTQKHQMLWILCENIVSRMLWNS